MSVPWTKTRPLVGRSTPPRICKSVDLPEPLSPTIATRLPFSTQRLTCPKAFTSCSPPDRLLKHSQPAVFPYYRLPPLSNRSMYHICVSSSKLRAEASIPPESNSMLGSQGDIQVTDACSVSRCPKAAEVAPKSAKRFTYVMREAVCVQPSKDSTTTMSTKGQLTIPSHIRERLALRPGDRFSCQVADGSAIIIKKLDPPVRGCPSDHRRGV